MPVRATKRGPARVPFPRGADADVLICGASFAGLAVARELRSTRAKVLVLDRYEIGERQTSACAAPTEWLRTLGLEPSIRQTFGSLVVHTPRAEGRWPLPWTCSTFDYRELCTLLWAQRGPATAFETAKVEGRGDGGAGTVAVTTGRGVLRAPLVVDALGWRRVLGSGANVQPPNARLSRGLEVHPHGSGADLELWIDKRVIRAGYGWSFPAGHELRVGVGSFDPHDHVKDPTVRLAADTGVDAVRFQGHWIPPRLRPAADARTFFVGDSAGHCLPTTAEGIRPALYFGLACGRELRAIVEGRKSREEALRDYGAFSAAHRWKYEALFRVQQAVGHINPRPRAMKFWLRALTPPRLTAWAFERYLNIAPPDYALAGGRAPPPAEPVAA